MQEDWEKEEAYSVEIYHSYDIVTIKIHTHTNNFFSSAGKILPMKQCMHVCGERYTQREREINNTKEYSIFIILYEVNKMQT